MNKKVYICIDLKSFYASVECVERELDPLTTNLVVADKSRTDKTICLAVSPSLKEYGISGRARLFEVIEKVKEINNKRKTAINNEKFIGKSFDNSKLKNNKFLELDYIIATPRMSKYIEDSAKIYNIYLKYLSKEDIHIYSIDEVFCDITNYLKYYKCSSRELITKIMKDIFNTTSITATAGIGPNLFLAKVAMDIIAKNTSPDKYGVRCAELTEIDYRKKLWNHLPITDFWRIGRGYEKILKENNMYTMGDVARCSILNEQLLYKLFGVNAELLIDHAWGVETCTMENIKNYKSKNKSITSGQVLHTPYKYNKAKLVFKEMVDLLVLDLVKNSFATNQITLTVYYDRTNIFNNLETSIKNSKDKIVLKKDHGSERLNQYTSSTKIIMNHALKLFNKVTNKNYLIRKISISFHNLIDEKPFNDNLEQLSLFEDANFKKIDKEEKNLQKTIVKLKEKYGKNSILKGMDLEEGATTKERNNQIGGHKS